MKSIVYKFFNWLNGLLLKTREVFYKDVEVFCSIRLRQDLKSILKNLKNLRNVWCLFKNKSIWRQAIIILKKILKMDRLTSWFSKFFLGFINLKFYKLEWLLFDSIEFFRKELSFKLINIRSLLFFINLNSSFLFISLFESILRWWALWVVWQESDARCLQSRMLYEIACRKLVSN